MVVHELSCLSGRSMDGFLDLPRQFGQLLTSKECVRCNILLVGLGGSTLIKMYEMEVSGLAFRRNGCITQAFLSVTNKETTGLQALL